jgi:kynurenine formamidase
MHHAWGVFGSDDELGTINLLTPARVRAAATEIQSGVMFNLSLPLNLPKPSRWSRRTPYRHQVFNLDRNTQDDIVDNFYLQASSQWDALRHIAAREFGYYNGVSQELAGPNGQSLGIDRWAEHGIAGRAVLLDVWSHLNKKGQAYDPTAGFAITPELLEGVAAAENAVLQAGDVLMIRTGYLKAVLEASETQRAQFARAWPGLASGEEMARYLWDKHVAAVVTDNPAVETAPGDPAAGFLHRRLIPLLGMALGELFYLDGLAVDCERDGRFSCFFVAVPLNLPRGVGSPANALAIK